MATDDLETLYLSLAPYEGNPSVVISLSDGFTHKWANNLDLGWIISFEQND